jgi:hypothetical protein
MDARPGRGQDESVTITESDPYRVILIEGGNTEIEIKLPPHIPMPYFGVGDYRLRVDKAGVIMAVSDRRFLVCEFTILDTTNRDTLVGTRRGWVSSVDTRGAIGTLDFINEALTDVEKASVDELFHGKQGGTDWRDASVTLYDFGYAVHKAAELAIGKEILVTFRELQRNVGSRLHTYLLPKWHRVLR